MPNYVNRYLRLSILPENAKDPVIFAQNWKITFRIRKCASASFLSYNTAEISIYNMTSELQDKLSHRDLPVRLEAGYEEMHDIVFVGTVFNATTIKKTTEIITTLYCVSNTRAYENLVNICVQNMTVKNLIEKLCKENGVSYSLQTKRNDIVQKSYTGPFNKVIVKVCNDYNIGCGLDNGRLVFKDKTVKDTTISTTEIKVFTPNSGMLGSPTVTETGVRFKSLLQPTIQVNDYFRLEAPYADYNLSALDQAPGMVEGGNLNVLAHIDTRNYNGVYMALSLIFSGDTRGNSWYTEVEGSRIGPKYTYANR